MKRKYIPIIMMLVAGIISSLFTMIRGESLLYRMTALLCTMLFFYGLGQILYYVLNYFDRENEKRLAAENALSEEDEAAADSVTEFQEENIG
ncbi:MAG: hypothetical protein NC543_13460 [bacterium]|nr:hypothetical protein [bacterium]MCM1375618.1 hypothetical protein [Muribaculum sp.]